MKTEGKHTPGPWYIKHPTPYICATVRHTNDVPVAKVETLRTEEGPDEWKVNARLISLAPRILEALKKTLAIIGPPNKSVWADDNQIKEAWEFGESVIEEMDGCS